MLEIGENVRQRDYQGLNQAPRKVNRQINAAIQGRIKTDVKAANDNEELSSQTNPQEELQYSGKRTRATNINANNNTANNDVSEDDPEVVNEIEDEDDDEDVKDVMSSPQVKKLRLDTYDPPGAKTETNGLQDSPLLTCDAFPAPPSREKMAPRPTRPSTCQPNL